MSDDNDRNKIHIKEVYGVSEALWIRRLAQRIRHHQMKGYNMHTEDQLVAAITDEFEKRLQPATLTRCEKMEDQSDLQCVKAAHDGGNCSRRPEDAPKDAPWISKGRACWSSTSAESCIDPKACDDRGCQLYADGEAKNQAVNEEQNLAVPSGQLPQDILLSGARPITDADLIAENNAGYDLGRKHGKGEMEEQMQSELAQLKGAVRRFFEIDPAEDAGAWCKASSELVALAATQDTKTALRGHNPDDTAESSLQPSTGMLVALALAETSPAPQVDAQAAAKESDARVVWEIEAAITRHLSGEAAPEVVGEWRDIESAPKDGTRLLLYRPAQGDWDKEVIAMGHWHDDLVESPDRHLDADECERDHCGRNHERRLLTWVMNGVTSWPPTHWQPLPAPPSGGEPCT